MLRPPGSDGEGAAPSSGGSPSNGGSPSSGGSPSNGGSGGDGTGGEVPLAFGSCGCALEILDGTNTDCGDCVQLAKDEANDPCFEAFDDCLVDPGCLSADQRLIQQCGSDRTIECAEGALAGTPNASAERLIAYYGCLCRSCGACASSEGGAGGGGGAPFDASCTIEP